MSPLAISLRFLQTQTDERLLALARDGHERAFEALIRRYRGALLAYARRLVGRNRSPEDILQQALLQAWKALSAGSEVRDARAWLYRIVHNVAITSVRAQEDAPAAVYPIAGAIGVEQVVEQRQAARDALAGLAALPELQREVMLSTALDGRSHEEVAAALGLSSGSVRGLIYRARATLRAAAAAVTPSPVIEWSIRHADRRPGGLYDALAGGGAASLAGAGSSGLLGGGSAPLAGLMLKSGAVLAAGALAGAAALVVGHPGHRSPISHESIVGASASGGRARSAADEIGGTGSGIGVGEHRQSAEATARSRRDSSGGHDGRSPEGGGRDHSGQSGGSGSRGSDGGGGSDGGSVVSTSGSGGSRSGSDGGSGGGSSSGSSGSDGGATTATSTTGTSGGGGSSGGSGSSDGGTTTSSSGGTVTTTTSGSSDGGTSTSTTGGSSDGGSLSSGGSLTSTTGGSGTSTTDG